MASLRIESARQAWEENEDRRVKRSHIVAVINLDPHFEEIRVEPQEETRLVPLAGEVKTTRIGTSLVEENAQRITQMLQQNVTIFGWITADMPSVD